MIEFFRLKHSKKYIDWFAVRFYFYSCFSICSFGRDKSTFDPLLSTTLLFTKELASSPWFLLITREWLLELLSRMSLILLLRLVYRESMWNWLVTGFRLIFWYCRLRMLSSLSRRLSFDWFFYIRWGLFPPRYCKTLLPCNSEIKGCFSVWRAAMYFF